MSAVLITGGTGLIGRRLSEVLTEKGYEVMLLSRSGASSFTYSTYRWSPEHQEIAYDAISRADYVVHLGAENIGAKRWTESRKRKIMSSRVKSGQLLAKSIKKNDKKIKAYISASAIGYYGAVTGEKIFREEDPPGDDFLGTTCQAWEKPARTISDQGIRTVILRIGVVLAKETGALPRLVRPIKYGLGAALGSGQQYIPWIHLDDLVGILVKSIEDEEMDGVYNAVSPEPVNNEVFTQVAARVLKRPLVMPKIPAFMLRMYLGEMADVVLEGSRVSSDKISAAGYRFVYPALEKALADILLKHQQSEVL